MGDVAIPLTDIARVPLDPPPTDVAVDQHWLAINGVQPAIAGNPLPEGLQFSDVLSSVHRSNVFSVLARQRELARAWAQKTAAATGADPVLLAERLVPGSYAVNALEAGDLSVEQQSLLSKITQIVREPNAPIFSKLEAAISSDPGLAELTPRLTVISSTAIAENRRSLPILRQSLRLLLALAHNSAASLHAVENQVLECILTCLLLPSIGPVTLSPGARHDDAAIMANGAPGEHWELRTFAAGMLALANQRFISQPSRIRILKTLSDALVVPQTGAASSHAAVFGAVAGLACQGAEQFELLVLPNLTTIVDALQRDVDKLYSTTKPLMAVGPVAGKARAKATGGSTKKQKTAAAQPVPGAAAASAAAPAPVPAADGALGAIGEGALGGGSGALDSSNSNGASSGLTSAAGGSGAISNGSAQGAGAVRARASSFASDANSTAVKGKSAKAMKRAARKRKREGKQAVGARGTATVLAGVARFVGLYYMQHTPLARSFNPAQVQAAAGYARISLTGNVEVQRRNRHRQSFFLQPLYEATLRSGKHTLHSEWASTAMGAAKATTAIIQRLQPPSDSATLDTEAMPAPGATLNRSPSSSAADTVPEQPDVAVNQFPCRCTIRLVLGARQRRSRLTQKGFIHTQAGAGSSTQTTPPAVPRLRRSKGGSCLGYTKLPNSCYKGKQRGAAIGSTRDAGTGDTAAASQTVDTATVRLSAPSGTQDQWFSTTAEGGRDRSGFEAASAASGLPQLHPLRMVVRTTPSLVDLLGEGFVQYVSTQSDQLAASMFV